MTLSSTSNTVNALGIFGRLSNEQEKYFDALEQKYSKKPNPNAGYDIFRHLTLTFIRDASVSDIRDELNLLKDLKRFLPLRLKAKRAFVKDEVTMPGAEHIAIEFGIKQTEKIVEFVRNRAGDNTVATPYTKVVWFVPKKDQQAVIDELSNFKELIFADFYLVANKQDDENTIYTTNLFESKRKVAR